MTDDCDHTYNLTEPFGIDDEELIGFSPEMCFVMGVEYGLFLERLSSGRAFTVQAHMGNSGRIMDTARRHGREIAPRSDGQWIIFDVCEEPQEKSDE